MTTFVIERIERSCDLPVARRAVTSGGRTAKRIHLIRLPAVLVVLNENVRVPARVNDAREQTVRVVLKLPDGVEVGVEIRRVGECFRNQTVGRVISEIHLPLAAGKICEKAECGVVLQLIDAASGVNDVGDVAFSFISIGFAPWCR